jgi:hypothetical protein
LEWIRLKAEELCDLDDGQRETDEVEDGRTEEFNGSERVWC